MCAGAAARLAAARRAGAAAVAAVAALRRAGRAATRRSIAPACCRRERVGGAGDRGRQRGRRRRRQDAGGDGGGASTCSARGLAGRRDVARLRPQRRDDCREVQADSDPREVGDEPLLIRRATGAPVFVARRPRRGGARPAGAPTRHTQVIVSDDGLQHHGAGARHRDLRVRRARHRQRLAAAGRPAARALAAPLRPGAAHRRARRHSPASRASARWPTHAVRARRHASAAGGTAPAGRVIAVAAHRQAGGLLRDAARSAASRCERRIALPDHHDFDGWLPPPGAAYTLICTEKDAVKLWRRAPDAWAVPLRVRHPQSGLLRSRCSTQSYHPPMDHQAA